MAPSSPRAERPAHAAEASACGKLILLGEHAVVHGVTALAVPVLERRTHVEVSLPDGASPDVVLHDERGHDTALAARMTRVALDAAGLPGRGARVRLRSEIPLGAGLGSSAALSVALVRAAASLARETLPPEEVARRAHALETLAHGTPSGIDGAVIAHERPIAFTRGGAPVPLGLPFPLRLAVGILRREGTTASLVASVRERKERDPARFEAALAGIRWASDAFRRDAIEGAGVHLARLAQDGRRIPDPVRAMAAFLLIAPMASCRRSLADLGVSSPAVERACDLAVDAGALAAKLSGAGGGGAVIALLPAQDRAPDLAVRDALASAGALETFVTEIPAS